MHDITLVQPPNPQLHSPDTRWPLGLAYLEAVLQKKGVDVDVTDLRRCRKVNVDRILPARFIGITATTGEIEFAREIAQACKARDPECVTVLGGPHATFLPDDCLADFDQIVKGEAESVILDIVSGDKPEKVVVGQPVQDLDMLPFPVRHPFSFSNELFKGSAYGKGPIATNILSSRGCNWACSFCREQSTLVRLRSPANFVAEIASIVDEWDCRHFRFEDDTFTVKPSRLQEICRLLKPLNIHFRAHTRVDVFTPGMAWDLKQAGCDEIGFGVESADQYVLDLNRKRQTVEQCSYAVRTAEQTGIMAKVFFICGLPGETDATIEFNKEFMCEARPSKWIISRCTPYPGSDLWAHPGAYGVTWIDRDFSHFWNFPDGPTMVCEKSTLDDLKRRYSDLYNYLRENFPQKNRRADGP